jgi:hypothetical protein
MTLSHIEKTLDRMASDIVGLSVTARILHADCISAGACAAVRDIYVHLDDIEQLMIECEAFEAALLEDEGAR